MRRAIDETEERRRERQIAHNEAHGITPKGLEKKVADIMEGVHVQRKRTDQAREVAEPQGPIRQM